MANAWTFSVALRYILSSSHNRLLSFMTLVSMSGLILGVMVLTVVLSVMNGFEAELQRRVLGVLPHGTIESRTGLQDWREIAIELERDPEITGVAPFVRGQGLLVAQGNLLPVDFYGIDVLEENSVSIVHRYMKSGSLDALSHNRWRIVIGQGLAEGLGVDLGDKVAMVLPEARVSLAGPIPRSRRFTVAGIFEVGADLDKSTAYLAIDDAARLLRVQGVQGVRVQLSDLYNAPEIIWQQLLALGRPDLFGRSWMSSHGNLYAAIQVQKRTMMLLLFLLITVAAFNIVSNLVMTVNNKQGDIAILKTIGAPPGAILVIFVAYGALVGLLGIAIGLLLGFFASNWVSELYGMLDALFGLNLMREYFIHYLPSEIWPEDFLVVGLGSFLICVTATLYPAFKASKAIPIEGLQYEG